MPIFFESFRLKIWACFITSLFSTTYKISETCVFSSHLVSAGKYASFEGCIVKKKEAGASFYDEKLMILLNLDGLAANFEDEELT